ncbi:MAG TPA: hypothetical protein VFW66_11570 [Gemmatimonadales bacterium]|nr:hypothetical protein [Gemmatimonadales bacterium]
MSRSRSSRLSALLLTVIFSAGSFGLSAFDALAFHRSGVARGATGPHYEAAGTVCGHGDRCMLGSTLPGPRLATPFKVAARLAPVVETRQPPAPIAALPSFDRRTLPQPRAPPPPLA